MTASIHVEASKPLDVDDFAAFLEGRGLIGEVVPFEDRFDVEVAYARNEEDRLREDVLNALRSWLAERELPLVPITTDERYVLRPPGE